MKRLDNGDYLVPALRAAEAIEVVRREVPRDRAPVIVTARIGLTNNAQEDLWLVHPYYRGPDYREDDSEPVDSEWISRVTPAGWSVNVETKNGLLIIRSLNRSMCLIEPFSTDYIVRGFVRRAFNQIGVTI